MASISSEKTRTSLSLTPALSRALVEGVYADPLKGVHKRLERVGEIYVVIDLGDGLLARHAVLEVERAYPSLDFVRRGDRRGGNFSSSLGGGYAPAVDTGCREREEPERQACVLSLSCHSLHYNFSKLERTAHARFSPQNNTGGPIPFAQYWRPKLTACPQNLQAIFPGIEKWQVRYGNIRCYRTSALGRDASARDITDKGRDVAHNCSYSSTAGGI